MEGASLLMRTFLSALRWRSARSGLLEEALLDVSRRIHFRLVEIFRSRVSSRSEEL